MLKEFDLDAPSLPKEVRQAFRSQTRCITALYEKVFKPVGVIEKGWKILIEVVPVITKPHVRDLLGVLTQQVKGDPHAFLNADREKKPHIALEMLTQGTQLLGKELGLPTQAFEDAERQVRQRNFVNKWTWKQGLWNKAHSISCDIEVDHGLDDAKIIACFKSADRRHLASVEICSAPPTEFAFVPLLGKARWIDDRVVELTSQNGNMRWRANVPDAPLLTPRG
jgi:hypothetical protein